MNARFPALMALMAVAVLLGGCEGVPPAPAPVGHCAAREETQDAVEARYECPDGTWVYTFTSEKNRDDWLVVADLLDAEVLAQDRLWVKVMMP